MSTATLNSNRVTNASVYLPAAGVWWAEVTLDAEAALSGRVELKLADLTLSGTVISGGAYAGRSHYRIAGGAGGWGKVLPAKHEANDGGVRLRAVVGAAASACGETLDLAAIDPSLVAGAGTAWLRPKGPASHVLHLLAPNAWYVANDGTTKLGARAVPALISKPVVQSVDRARGVVVLAPDTLAELVPGQTIEGITAIDVCHELTPDGLRTRIYGKGAVSRRVQALQRLFDAVRPNDRYRGVFEYRVLSQEGERVNLQPVLLSLGMPDVRRCHVRPGVPGVRAELVPGTRVLVSFLNSDPSQPAIVGFASPEGEGFIPSSLTIAAGPTGEAPNEHAASIEGVAAVALNVIAQLLVACGGSGPLTGTALQSLLPANLGGTALPGADIVSLALLGASTPATGTIATCAPSLATALSAKTPDPSGLLPGVGWPDVKGS